MLSRLFLLALLVLAAPSSAVAQDVAGSWALEVDGAVIFRFDLAQDGDGWSGTWTRPMALDSDGDRFGGFSRQAVEVPSSDGTSAGEWAELSFTDPRPGALPDIFRFRRIDDGHAEMIYTGTGWAPYELQRVAPERSLGPYEIGKIYTRSGILPRTSKLPVLFSSPLATFPRIDALPVIDGPAAPATTAEAPPPEENARERPAMIGR